MPLSKQLAEVRLGKVDQKTSAKLSIPGTLTTAQNVIQNTTGRYDRRAGTSLLTTQSGTRTLHDHNRELLIGTADTLYSRFGSANNSRGVLTSFDTRHDPVNTTPFEQTCHDMVITNSQEWSVWRDARANLKYAVKDVTTGAYVVSEGSVQAVGGQSGDLDHPRIFAVGTNVLITYLKGDETSETDLFGRKIAVASPTVVGSESTIDSQVVPGGAGHDSFAGYDGLTISADEIVLAYIASGTTDERVRLKKWNVTTMTATTTLTEAADRGPGKGGVAILGTFATDYYVAHAQGDTTNLVRLLIADTTLASFTTTATVKTYGAATTLRSVSGFVSGGNSFILVTRMATSGSTTRPILDYFLRTSGGVNSDVSNFIGAALASHTFASGSGQYVMVNYAMELPASTTNTRSSYFFLDLSNGMLIGRALTSVAAVPNPTIGTARTLPAVQTTATGFAIAAGFSVTTTQMGAATVYADLSPRKRWVEVSGATVIPGSWPRMYDGLGVTELGFEFPPNSVTVAQSGASGLANGTYYYRMTWYWIDGTGRVHESEPSAAEAFTVTGGPRTVTLTVESLLATRKTSQLSVQDAILRIYRTTVNPSAAATASFFLAGTATNSFSATTVAFADTVDDTTLQTQELLYTDSQTILENTSSSPATTMAAWNQRLWSTDKDSLEFSKDIIETHGVQPNDTQFIVVADSYADFVALADGGSRLLAFKKNAIYSVTGFGPDNTGAGEFPVVDRLELPLGAKSQFSVLSTEIGVFFQDDSTSQIWLLGDGGAEYIGAPIETIISGLTIVDSVQVGRQIRFYTSNGTTLVYDLHHKQWTWFTGQTASCAAAIDGVAHYATSAAGAVRYDDAAVWTEAGTTYQAVLETSWLSFAGLSGHQRTYNIIVLGDAAGSHTLSIKPTFKFGTGTYTQTIASASLGATHGFRVEGPVKLAYQRSTSLRVRLEDSSPSNAGFNLEAIVLDLGLSRQIARLPSANRAT